MPAFIDAFVVGIGLSADAFAVSVCRGLAMRRLYHKRAFIIALFFGGFQALMPCLGWLLTSLIRDKLNSFGHFISFALLAFIGGKMIFEALSEKNEKCDVPSYKKLDVPELFVMAIATSIDALAAGVKIAFDGEDILLSASVIGAVTFVICYLGVAIGNKFGSIYKRKAEIAGGVVLILLGVKILIQSLMKK